jgi:hypothetical protein
MKKNSNMKGLMSKMISCVINYPSIVNDPESSGVIEERVRKLPQYEVLLELIHIAQFEPDITKEALIKPYEDKTKIYQRLKHLCVMEPFLSENEAKIEFMSALTAAEKHQQRIKVEKMKKALDDFDDEDEMLFEDEIPFEKSSDDKKDTASLLAEIENLKYTIDRKTDLERDYIKFRKKASKVKTKGKELFIVLACLAGPAVILLLFFEGD